IVFLGGTPEEFIAACERALAANKSERATRQDGMRGVLSRTSWERTAAAMEALIAPAARPRRPDTRNDTRNDARTVVIGAGPTGLSAAYHLGEDSVLIEQNST